MSNRARGEKSVRTNMHNAAVKDLETKNEKLVSQNAILNARLLSTLDSLDTLQARSNREVDGLTQERDGLKALVAALRGRLDEAVEQNQSLAEGTRRIMQEVAVVNDYEVIDHGNLSLNAPIDRPRIIHFSRDLHSSSSDDDDSDTTHLTTDRSPRGARRSHRLRDRVLIVELSREIETERRARRIEVAEKEDEIRSLRQSLATREAEMKVLSSSRQTAGSSNDLAGAEEDLPPTDVDEKLESEIVAIRSELARLRASTSGPQRKTETGAHGHGGGGNDFEQARRDLDLQVDDLKVALRELTNERENLIWTLSRISPGEAVDDHRRNSNSNTPMDLRGECYDLSALLEQSRAELQDLAAAAESKERNFEIAAERARIRLGEQKAELDIALQKVEYLEGAWKRSNAGGESLSRQLKDVQAQNEIMSRLLGWEGQVSQTSQ